jgi:hypothetical protein
MVLNECEPGAPPEGIAVPYRSPRRAAAWSALFIGHGQVYNKQLDKAVLLWLWTAMLFILGGALLLLGLLGRWLPRVVARPPLGDFVADHAGLVWLLWLGALFLLWVFNVRDAWISAERINRGEVTVRYPMRRQLVHVLGAQLLGFIPLIGFLFPPGVVAEAIDAARERRSPDGRRLLRDGGQALAEWAVTKVAFYALWAALALWALWWLLRMIGVAP